MTENKQLKNVIFWLQSQGYIDSQKDLSKKLGYNEAFMSQMVSGVKSLSEKCIMKIVEFSNEKVNPDYLRGKDVPMLLYLIDAPQPKQEPKQDDKELQILAKLVNSLQDTVATQKALITIYEAEIKRLQRAAQFKESGKRAASALPDSEVF